MRAVHEYNLNFEVFVKLTEAGRRVAIDVMRGESYLNARKIEEDYYKFQLWEIFKIFGPSLDEGSPIFLEENAVFLPKSSIGRHILRGHRKNLKRYNYISDMQEELDDVED